MFTWGEVGYLSYIYILLLLWENLNYLVAAERTCKYLICLEVGGRAVGCIWQQCYFTVRGE